MTRIKEMKLRISSETIIECNKNQNNLQKLIQKYKNNISISL